MSIKMSINLKRAAGFVLVLVGTLMIATMAEAKEFKMKVSGWGGLTEIDTNQDGSRATSWTTEGWGTFGRSTSNSLGESRPIEPEDWFTEACPTGALLKAATYTMITRYHNGDLIFFALDESEDNPNTACMSVAPEDLYTMYYTFDLLITGGTGRYEGVTGWAIMTGACYPPLQWDVNAPAHYALSGTLEGEIFLADDDDDDDDDD